MAVIDHAGDVHTWVTDNSQGFPHSKRPATGVYVSMRLTPSESELLLQRFKAMMSQQPQTYAQALSRIFGSGAWQFSMDGKTLTVSHQLNRNPYGARSTGRLVAQVLAAVNRRLQDLQAGE